MLPPMPKTKYDKQRGAESTARHKLAEHVLYPRVFGTRRKNLKFRNCRVNSGDRLESVCDGQLKIDCLVYEKSDVRWRTDFRWAVQERFLDAKRYTSHPDYITVTEFNTLTGRPSEVYAGHFDIFLYGYVDDSSGTFYNSIAVEGFRLRDGIYSGAIEGVRDNNGGEKQQDFIKIPYGELLRVDAVMWQQGRGKPLTMQSAHEWEL